MKSLHRCSEQVALDAREAAESLDDDRQEGAEPVEADTADGRRSRRVSKTALPESRHGQTYSKPNCIAPEM